MPAPPSSCCAREAERSGLRSLGRAGLEKKEGVALGLGVVEAGLGSTVQEHAEQLGVVYCRAYVQLLGLWDEAGRGSGTALGCRWSPWAEVGSGAKLGLMERSWAR